jgi:excinuclease ABC subunit A
MGPGAGDEGGQVVVAGVPTLVAATKESRTASYLSAALDE